MNNASEEAKPAKRLAPVQGDYRGHPADPDYKTKPGNMPGTVPWEVHEQAWKAYAEAGHGSQDAERIAQRGGFGYDEMQHLLAGHYDYGRCQEEHPPVPGWVARTR